MKKRILLCNEASYRNSGFSVYGHEVLSRLHATGKYELAEYGTYGDTSDPGDDRWRDLPWKFYPVMPDRHDRAQVDEYNARVGNQFGEWHFEHVCCDFRPDVVWDVRDWWMLEYEERSPFRPYYHWAIMPTVDALPQDDWWMATYLSADSVFAYSDWGLEVLKSQGGPGLKAVCSAPPGADTVAYAPAADKKAHKRQMSLPEDTLVVGTVMRNQKRKLYPELVSGFARFLREAPPELARRTYLYLHVRYPDTGWDVPRLIKEAGIGHRTLFTYVCRDCGVCFPSFFADAVAFCRNCGRLSAELPSSDQGAPKSVMNHVMNFFDLYVQYANSEGFGMPQVEAAAAGVPVMSVDYSAMSDVVRKVRGIPLRVLALQKECETGCFRAVPDEADLVRQLVDFLSLPESVRRKRGYEARQGVLRHYTYERTAKVWEDHFDALAPKDRALTWEGPARPHAPRGPVPQGMTDDEWVRWGITHLAGRPDLLGGYTALRMARDLTWKSRLGNVPRAVFSEFALLGERFQPSGYTRDDAAEELLEMCRKRNYWEERRAEARRDRQEK